MNAYYAHYLHGFTYIENVHCKRPIQVQVTTSAWLQSFEDRDLPWSYKGGGPARLNKLTAYCTTYSERNMITAIAILG